LNTIYILLLLQLSKLSRGIKTREVLRQESRICFVITLLNICRLLPTKNNRRMKEIDREIRKILHGIIRKRERAFIDSEGTNDDLLGLLVESNMRESNGNAKLGMTTEDIIEECKLFYFAGMETTSVLLTWTLILLSMHPEWQEQAREEVLNHFGMGTPDFDNLNRLKIVSLKSLFFCSIKCRNY
jgi:cytochrome P450